MPSIQSTALQAKASPTPTTFSQPIMVVNKKKKPDDENYGLVLVRFFEQTAVVKQSEPKTFHLQAVWVLCDKWFARQPDLRRPSCVNMQVALVNLLTNL